MQVSPAEKNVAHKLLEEGLPLFGKNYTWEAFRKPIIRCYNCQKSGHIAKHWRGICRCHHCGKNHQAIKNCDNHLIAAIVINKVTNHNQGIV